MLVTLSVPYSTLASATSLNSLSSQRRTGQQSHPDRASLHPWLHHRQPAPDSRLCFVRQHFLEARCLCTLNLQHATPQLPSARLCLRISDAYRL
ncbi:hypothetical protein HYQ46_010658 [Verticillium longisporum]|nr:hypothetical protein HYQ46_010658 [Verticillium longisporum]